MNKKNDELKERLKVLELEQNRLDAALNNVELQAQIRKLRTLLFSHDEVGLSILTANKPITNLAKDNNQKLEQQNDDQIDDEIYSLNLNQSDIVGYVVCLMFSPSLPPEWSGKEWHAAGKGKCYTEPELAYQCMQQLQKKWPNYPINVLERKISK